MALMGLENHSFYIHEDVIPREVQSLSIIFAVISFIHGHAEHEEMSAAETGGHDHGGGHYFQYANVPAKKEYSFGYRKGNDYHYIERDEKGKDHTFKTKVKWADKKGGYGEHIWDYNHAPKYGHGDDHRKGHGHDDGYGKGHGSGGHGHDDSHGGKGYGHDDGYGKGHDDGYGH